MGRSRASADIGLFANELLFDRALSVDETHMFSYTLDLTGAYLDDEELARRRMKKGEAVDGQRAFRQPTHTYVLEARFHPSALPVRLYHVETSRVGGSEQMVGELILDAHHTTHVALQDVLPWRARHPVEMGVRPAARRPSGRTNGTESRLVRLCNAARA